MTKSSKNYNAMFAFSNAYIIISSRIIFARVEFKKSFYVIFRYNINEKLSYITCLDENYIRSAEIG